jgi:hypothetical protein
MSKALTQEALTRLLVAKRESGRRSVWMWGRGLMERENEQFL